MVIVKRKALVFAENLTRDTQFILYWYLLKKGRKKESLISHKNIWTRPWVTQVHALAPYFFKVHLVQDIPLNVKLISTAFGRTNRKWVSYRAEQPSHASRLVASYVGHCTILPSMTSSSWWPLPFRISDPNVIWISNLHRARYIDYTAVLTLRDWIS